MTLTYDEKLYEVEDDGASDVFRLLQPIASPSEVPCYDLKTFARAHAPPYAALSYSWGSKSHTASILLQTAQTKGTLEITLDLSEALAHIAHLQKRPGAQTPWLWVDQICINQDDNLEKAHQVSRMGSIYTNARNVFVWLGKGLTESGSVLSASDTPGDGLSNAKIFQLLDQGKHGWWRRLWVVQELALASRVYVCIGSLHLTWDAFVRTFSTRADDLVKSLSEHDKETYQARIEDAKAQIRALQDLRAKTRELSEGQDLVDLLDSTQRSNVTVSLDRVYGLLGLASEEWRECIPVRYGVPLQAVFSLIVRHIRQRDGTWDVLFSGWPRGARSSGPEDRAAESSATNVVPSNRDSRLQSWTPNFMEPRQAAAVTVTMFQQLLKEGYSFQYRGESVFLSDFEASGVVDQETEVMQPCLNMAPPISSPDAVPSLIAPPISLPDAMWTALEYEWNINKLSLDVRNDIPVHIPSTLLPRSGSLDAVEEDGLLMRAYAFDTVSELCSPPTHTEEMSALGQRRRVLHSAIHSEDKVWFVTAKGHTALGFKVRVGDEIIVPETASAPLVVRRIQERIEDYAEKVELVSDCYVDGVMGDAFAKEKARNPEVYPQNERRYIIV